MPNTIQYFEGMPFSESSMQLCAFLPSEVEHVTPPKLRGEPRSTGGPASKPDSAVRVAKQGSVGEQSTAVAAEPWPPPSVLQLPPEKASLSPGMTEGDEATARGRFAPAASAIASGTPAPAYAGER